MVVCAAIGAQPKIGSRLRWASSRARSTFSSRLRTNSATVSHTPKHSAQPCVSSCSSGPKENPTVVSGRVYGVLNGAPQKIFIGLASASRSASRTPSRPATTRNWSRPEITEVVPKRTAASANIVTESLEHSRWRWPSMSPGVRYLPVASTISVSGPSYALTSPVAATRSPVIATSAG